MIASRVVTMVAVGKEVVRSPPIERQDISYISPGKQLIRAHTSPRLFTPPPCLYRQYIEHAKIELALAASLLSHIV